MAGLPSDNPKPFAILLMPRFLAASLFLLPLCATAQTPPARHATVFDLTGAVGPTLNYTSAAAWQLWGLDQGGRFQMGLGVRASYFFAEANDYYAQTGPSTYSLAVQKPQQFALNAAFHLRARVAGPVRIGFNLDALGVTVGADRPGVLGSSDGVLLPVSAQVSARPVRGNLLKGGTPDIGSLNTELYASVALPRGFSVRVAYCHIVTAYEANDYRYRRFRNLAALGLSYQLP